MYEVFTFSHDQIEKKTCLYVVMLILLILFGSGTTLEAEPAGFADALNSQSLNTHTHTN